MDEYALGFLEPDRFPPAKDHRQGTEDILKGGIFTGKELADKNQMPKSVPIGSFTLFLIPV
tara:strand:- start:70 stop:252 length:183 start_codon:yes stop_codon:yes gene_type:complete